MKSRPEYHDIFNSPTVFYRVIHTISTQKYRLLVRRYIFDLFDVDLDTDVVRIFTECEKSLRLMPTGEPSDGRSPTANKVVSIFSHQVIASDESDVEDELPDLQGSRKQLNSGKRPVSLRPARTVVGFDGA
jgi:rapamycin-insensitive companion of mTOR